MAGAKVVLFSLKCSSGLNGFALVLHVKFDDEIRKVMASNAGVFFDFVAHLKMVRDTA